MAAQINKNTKTQGTSQRWSFWGCLSKKLIILKCSAIETNFFRSRSIPLLCTRPNFPLHRITSLSVDTHAHRVGEAVRGHQPVEEWPPSITGVYDPSEVHCISDIKYATCIHHREKERGCVCGGGWSGSVRGFFPGYRAGGRARISKSGATAGEREMKNSVWQHSNNNPGRAYSVHHDAGVRVRLSLMDGVIKERFAWCSAHQTENTNTFRIIVYVYIYGPTTVSLIATHLQILLPVYILCGQANNTVEMRPSALMSTGKTCQKGNWEQLGPRTCRTRKYPG